MPDNDAPRGEVLLNLEATEHTFRGRVGGRVGGRVRSQSTPVGRMCGCS